MLIRQVQETFAVGENIALNGERFNGEGKVVATAGFNGEVTDQNRKWRTRQPYPQVIVKLNGYRKAIHLNGDDLVEGKLTKRRAVQAAPARPAAPKALFAVGETVVVTTDQFNGCGEVQAVYMSADQLPKNNFMRLVRGATFPVYKVVCDDTTLLIDTNDARNGSLRAEG